MCIDYINCNNHGDCVESKCYCDIGWFSENCSINIKQHWRMSFYFYIAAFIMIFAYTAYRALFKLSNIFQDYK